VILISIKLNSTDWTALGIHETAEVFAKQIATLWKVHPFREGNTRTVITFATQFAEACGFRIDKTLLKDSAACVRDALVKASDVTLCLLKYKKTRSSTNNPFADNR